MHQGSSTSQGAKIVNVHQLGGMAMLLRLNFMRIGGTNSVLFVAIVKLSNIEYFFINDNSKTFHEHQQSKSILLVMRSQLQNKN